ncbi:MAG TPA: (2Fe-2S)-binding protein [Oscillospiraceae bacterium]|nr:(2Fe-2S)-binding protein [Oscillospiraceae bacterium]
MEVFYVKEHPILSWEFEEQLTIYFEDKALVGWKGQTIGAILLAHGIRYNRETHRRHEPRGIFCGIGQCSDCYMIVDGEANVKVCTAMAVDQMIVERQYGVAGAIPQHIDENVGEVERG